MYRRTDTAMDRVSVFTPQSFLNGLGEWDESLSLDWNPGAEGDGYGGSYWPTDPGPAYPTDYGYPSAPGGVTAPASSGIVDALKSLVPAVRDIYLSASAAEAQKKVMELNIARAQRGLPPINAAQYGLQPGVSVGVSPQLRRDIYTAGGIGIGTLAALGVGAWLLLGSGKRRR